MGSIDHVGDRNLVLVGEAASVQVWHDAEVRWLYVRWRGPYEPRAAQEGWALLQCLHRQPCTQALNDARFATAWAGQEHWAGTSLFPMLVHAGVQHMACVYSQTLPGRASLDMTLHSTTLRSFL